MSDEVTELEEFGQRWARAEVDQQLEMLADMAHDDFVLVGPLGFMLDKEQWLDRYRSGDFITTALAWRDIQVRVFGETAIVVGVHDQQAAYRGQANNGQFRATHVLVREHGAWRFVSMHLSPIAAPPAGARPPRA